MARATLYSALALGMAVVFALVGVGPTVAEPLGVDTVAAPPTSPAQPQADPGD